MAHTDLKLAAGTVTGRDHRNVNVHKNGQDGFTVIRSKACTVAVIADGCGSSPHSEVGAKLGAHLVAQSLNRQMLEQGKVSWPQTLRELLANLNFLAVQMGGSFSRTVQDYFLFTLVGALLNDDEAVFFALGDGIIIVNGEHYELGPFASNQPPYAGYNLLGSSVDAPEGSTEIKPVATVRLEELEHFLIGSDGVNDLIAAQNQNLPGLPETVGPINRFWEDERIFDDNKPDALARRLRLISRDWPRRDPQPGLLPDDTTIVAGRRLNTETL